MPTSRAVFNFTDMKFVGSLQQNQPIADGSGGLRDNFVTLFTARCSLEKISGMDGFPEGKMEYNKRFMLKCRSQKAFGQNANGNIDGHNITAQTIWVIRGEQYDIDDWELIDMTPQFFVFSLTKTQH